jgi:hypothetical protein
LDEKKDVCAYVIVTAFNTHAQRESANLEILCQKHLKTDRLGLKPTTKVAGINHKTCYVLGVMLISQAVNLGAGVPTPAACLAITFCLEDDGITPTIKCANCLNWHHVRCVLVFPLDVHHFFCHDCTVSGRIFQHRLRFTNFSS